MPQASGGYLWTVIRVDDRTAIDCASIESNIHFFANFIAGQVRWSMKNMKA